MRFLPTKKECPHPLPMAFLGVPVVFLLDDDWYFLSGSHVVVGLDLERRRESIKISLKFAGKTEPCKASAHHHLPFRAMSSPSGTVLFIWRSFPVTQMKIPVGRLVIKKSIPDFSHKPTAAQNDRESSPSEARRDIELAGRFTLLFLASVPLHVPERVARHTWMRRRRFPRTRP